MFERAESLLQKYWGHAHFRETQDAVVRAAVEGNDVFALLPTGGGKSICFQIPALVRPGVCLVVSPLLALMKDQVEQLNKRGISATYLSSELNFRELEILLDEVSNKKHKFLYVAPERLLNINFRARARHLNITTLAIDEAHCISQWGHDFRPAYLAIPEFAAMVPEALKIAVTATATPQVVAEIKQHLFPKGCSFFQKSFSRSNISYNTLQVNNKEEELLQRIQSFEGCGIVYCNSRRRTEELAKLFDEHGISAAAFHAGLSTEAKNKAFQKWVNNEVRVMTATNAFGMGIDKADVRFVIHADLPVTPEAYFQEAGRAGRDEQDAFALLLWHEADFDLAKKIIESRYPPLELIQEVYQALANIHRIAIGTGENELFALIPRQIAERTSFSESDISAALLLLDRAGYISIVGRGLYRSRVHVISNREDLRVFSDNHPEYEALLRSLFRLYGGIWEYATPISEYQLSEALQVPKNEIDQQLIQLHTLQIIEYAAATTQTQYTYPLPRVAANDISLHTAIYKQRRELDLEKLDAMHRFVSAETCRQQSMIGYFGEESGECGKCDVCQSKKNIPSLQSVVEACREPKRLEELVSSPIPYNKHQVLDVLHAALKEGKVAYTNGTYKKT